MKLSLILTAVCALAFFTVTASAQEGANPGPRRDNANRGGMRGGAGGGGGGGMFGGFGALFQMVMQMDTNKNNQIEKEELDAGAPALVQKIKDSQAALVKLVDKNADGKLDDQERDELNKLVQAVEQVRALQTLKANRDDKNPLLTDDELGALPQRLNEMVDRFNNMRARGARRPGGEGGAKPEAPAPAPAPAPVTP